MHFFDKWYQQATKSPTELGEEDIRNLQVEYLSKFGWTLAPSGGASGNQTCHDARTGNTFDVGGANPNAVLSDVTPRYIIVPDAAALAALAATIAANRSLRLNLVGHTTAGERSTETGARALALRRAEAALVLICSHGLSRRRFRVRGSLPSDRSTRCVSLRVRD